MVGILKKTESARAVRIYSDGKEYEFSSLDERFAKLKEVWEKMTAGAFEMPAFGVSINELTQKQKASGLWIEFLFGDEFMKDEMPFDSLLIRCEEKYRGFNLERGIGGEYSGRCFYLDLKDKDMSGLVSCIKLLTK